MVNHWEKNEEHEGKKTKRSVRCGGKLMLEDGAQIENNLIWEHTMVRYFCLGHAQILTDAVAGHAQNFFSCLLYKTYSSSFKTANNKRQYKKRRKKSYRVSFFTLELSLCVGP